MNKLVIYRSSAGSGKTFTLVKEFLKIVLQNPTEYRHILAITFTNKATGEMKGRIIAALSSLSDGVQDGMTEHLQRDLQMSLEELQERASVVLEKVLHDYSSFSVSTIDSFFQKIIRSLSKEMNLPLRYDVEINRDKVIEDVTEKLLNDTGKDAELTQWLKNYIIYRLDDNKSLHIEDEIHILAAELFKEDFYESMSKSGKTGMSTDEFIKKMQQIKTSFEMCMKKLGQAALDEIKHANLTIEDFNYGKTGVASYFKKIASYPHPKNYIPSSRILSVYESGTGWASKSSPKNEDVKMLGENVLFPILEEAIQLYQNSYKDYITSHEILKLFYIYGIVQKLKEKLNEYRRENNIILISDTETLLKKFISDNDTPFVFEKTGNKYHHFLLDEFQDTSNSQWNNILPLLKNAISEGNFSMLVGDVKQSIYRWRGGNMELLLYKVQDEFRQFKEMISEESLDTNYRSKKNIVEFNNDFFIKAAEIISESGVDEKLMKAYAADGVKQFVSEKNNAGGFVKIEFVSTEKNEEGKTLVSWKEKALNKLLYCIKELEFNNYELKDISIIVRNNSEAIEISSFLAANGYSKIISPASLLLSRSPLVQLLICTMKFLLNPEDVISGTNINYYYHEHLSKNSKHTLHELFTSLKLTKNNTFNIYDTLPNVLKDEIPLLKNMSVFDLSENLIRIFSIHDKNDAYLQRFQDLCLEFTASNSPHTAAFIDWWEHEMDEENHAILVPEDENAITIISIHKSKGLQFPVVIMPFLEWELSPKTGQVMWFSSDESRFDEFPMYPVQSGKIIGETHFSEDYNEEVTRNYLDNLNLLYVAFTRPENVFYAFCPMSAGDSKVSGLVLRSLRELYPDKIQEEEDTITYSIGLLEKNSTSKNKIIESSEESTRYAAFVPWQNRLQIRCKHARIWDVSTDKTSIIEKINYGLLMHEILASVNTKADIAPAIEKLYYEGILSSEEKISLQKRIEELLNIDAIGKWFTTEWKVKTESEIILPGKGSIRPDRVLIKDRKAVIIDYKTGKPDLEDEAQVRNYAEVLSVMGYEDIEKYLIYIADKNIVFLND